MERANAHGLSGQQPLKGRTAIAGICHVKSAPMVASGIWGKSAGAVPA
jgi:hypothetical protein